MNLKEIKALTNEELLAELLRSECRVTKEVNTRRGLSKKSELLHDRLIAMSVQRFNLNADLFNEHYEF